jgi:NitT/TauT family transport system substrate-binding protein
LSRPRYLLSVLVGSLAVLGTAGLGLPQPADGVELQLKWVPQAQFAGHFAAKARACTPERLDVTIRPGVPDIVSEEVVVFGGAQFGIDWLLATLEKYKIDRNWDVTLVPQAST